MQDLQRQRVRMDQYREAFSREPWPISVRSTVPVTFSSAFASRNLGGYGIATAVSSEHTLEADGTGTDARDLHMVHVQLAGETRFSQGDHTALLRPGDVSVYNFRSPALTENRGTNVLTFLVPAQQFGIPAERLHEHSGLALDRERPLVQVLHPLARELTGSLDSIDDAVGTRVIQGIIDLLSAALVESGRQTDAGSGDTLLASILEYIDANLHRPGLTVTEIAAAHFVSPRKLHVLFEAHETTVAAWVRSRRLEGCKRDLEDSALAHLKIADIAARWGFTDAAQFSRQFAHRFGTTPRAHRSGSAGR